MKFKVTKIAAAVAAGLGVSVVGMNAARADVLMFPYFAVSDTVTSLITVINEADQVGASTVKPQTLHYRVYYKQGATVDNLTATCQEFDVRLPTSPNDIVSFDLQGRYGVDTLGVLAEPANRQIKANYMAGGRSFALMRGLNPARGFLIVDNNEAPNVEFEKSLFGEMMVVDFSEGAMWGYQAYNADRGNAADQFSFQDIAENAGQVIAGDRAVQVEVVAGSGNVTRFPNGRDAIDNTGRSPMIPTGIMPIAATGTTGDVLTRFFVTPIGHSVDTITKNAPQTAILNTATFANSQQGQLRNNLTTRIELTIRDRTGTINDAIFDRDENPISGQTPQNVTCIGSVPVESLLSAGALREVSEFGGWSGVQISSPGALVTFGTANADNIAPITNRSANTNEAIVIKLEFNRAGAFGGEDIPNVFNTANWLLRGHRESIRGSRVGGLVQNRFTQASAYDANSVPIDSSNSLGAGDVIPVQTSYSQ